MRNVKSKVVAGAAALAAVIGGGAALAADKLSAEQESDAIVADAAKQLGIDASKLDAALKGALANRVDAAVESGRLTKAQGDELKARITKGEVPLVGVAPGPVHHGGFGHRFGHHVGHLDAAASYLGVTEKELRASLDEGDTLAETAAERGKSVDGLVNALVTAAKADIAAAVAGGRLTEAQGAEILAGLPDRIESFVNGELEFRIDRGPRGFRFGDVTPAPAAADA